MKLPELKSLLKQNNISGYSYLNKPAMITILLEKGILQQEDLDKEKIDKKPSLPPIDEKYHRLRYIRNQPRRVEIKDVITNEVKTYPSIYSAGRDHKQSSKSILQSNGKLWRNRYEIKVFDR